MPKQLKIFIILAGLFFFCILFFLTGFNANKIRLFFNPKNITPVSPFYTFKTTREDLQFKFVFGDEDLAHFYLVLANKRLTEAEVLQSYNLSNLSKKQASSAKNYYIQAQNHLTPLRDKIDINYLLADSELVSKRLKNFE